MVARSVTLAGRRYRVGDLDPPALIRLPDLLPGGEPQQVRCPPPPAVPSEDVEHLSSSRVAGHPPGPGAGGEGRV